MAGTTGCISSHPLRPATAYCTLVPNHHLLTQPQSHYKTREGSEKVPVPRQLDRIRATRLGPWFDVTHCKAEVHHSSQSIILPDDPPRRFRGYGIDRFFGLGDSRHHSRYSTDLFIGAMPLAEPARWARRHCQQAIQ